MLFDIYNKTTKQPENGVYCETAQQLIGIYASVGEEIEIIKAIPDPVCAQTQTTPQLVQYQDMSPTPRTINPTEPQTESIFSDGVNIFKYDNGLLYKKDWVEITGDELETYKLVTLKNSKAIPLSDKQLFKKDWVVVERKAPAGNVERKIATDAVI